jgi:uncharacterized protein YihD (DUF1040 family)
MARDEKRIPEVIASLQQIWSENPDFRLGQLIMGIANTGEHAPKLFYLEDDVFIRQIDEFRTRLRGPNV